MFTTKKEVDKHVRTTLVKLRTENEKNLRGVTISKLYFKIGEYTSALQYVSSYLQVKNDSAQAYKLQGECYEKLNKIDKALKSYQQSLQLDSKQHDLVNHVCKLVYANESLLTSGQEQFWHDFASAQNCQHESVLNLKLKLMNRNNEDPKKVEELLLSKIMEQPTEVSFRIRLVKHYLDQNRVADAFRYVYDNEMKQNEFFAQSIDWYNIISSVLAKCNTEQKSKWPYWLLSVLTLERQCFLKLCSSEVMKQQQNLNLKECAGLLFELDQTLYAASSVVLSICSERELAAQFLHHYRGQLCLHAAAFLFKRERLQQSQSRDSTLNALALLLVAYNCGIASNDEPWLRNSNEATKQLIRLWSQEGAFRCAQSGRTLLSCIDDDKQNNSVMANIRKICTDWMTRDELVNQLRRISSNNDWRKSLFRILFGSRESLSSHLLKCSELEDINYELPTVSELDAYEECAQWLRPSSLAQMVYLSLGAANISDLTCQTFNGLSLSVQNLINCGAETLNQLDIDTFLYATTIQAKRCLELERAMSETVNKVATSVKPKMLLFANISSMLVTEEQSNWWMSAYKVCKNISAGHLAEIRQQLQYGIEAVRGVGGPKMDTIICLKLGQIFLKRTQNSSKVVERGFLEARAMALFKFGLHMIKTQNGRTIESRLFKYATGHDVESERDVDNLAEEAIAHIASHYFKSNDYEGCIDELTNVQLPYATYFISKAYRRMEESNQTPKKNKRIYIDKVNEYLQQTLSLLDRLNADQKHDLRGMVQSDMKQLQQHTTSLNNSFANGISFADVSLNESFSHRQRHDSTIHAVSSDELEKLMKKMWEMLVFVKDEVANVRDKLEFMEDKIIQIDEQLNKKQDANAIDAAGLDEILNMDEEIQAHAFINNASMFPNYGQQRIHTPNQMLPPTMVPGVAGAQHLNPYSNQYYNGVYHQMNMNQYQALLPPQRTSLVMPQQIPYADMNYNPDPRGGLIGLLTQQQPPVVPQPTTIPTSNTATLIPPMQTLPPQLLTPQPLPPQSLPAQSTSNASTEKPQQDVARSQWNATFINTPIEKAPPVNVVITNSDPLPPLQTTAASQPTFSVTIPSHHIKSSTTTNEPFSFNIWPKTNPPITTAAAQPVINLSKKDSVKPPTSIFSAPEKSKEENKTTKPNPFANFQFGDLSSIMPSSDQRFSSLLKVAEPTVVKPTENVVEAANTSAKDDDEECHGYEPTAEFTPVIALPDLVEVKTGEEEEIVKFEHRAKLLRYVKESKEWKERGVGNMKVLINKNDPNKVRLLMRRELVLKLCCNQMITKETKFTKLPKLETALSWYGQDFSENELQPELLAVRFKTAETCNEFHKTILDIQKGMKDQSSTDATEVQPAVKEKNETTKSKGFGDQFKPVAGSWNCDICYVSNNASDAKCVACNTPKDQPAAVATVTKPQSSTTTVKVDNGFGDKFKPKPGAWECKFCYITNKAADIHCVACESPKDDTIPKKEAKNILSSLTNPTGPKFSFGVPANVTPASTTTAFTAPSPSPFSFGAFTAMTTNNVSAPPTTTSTPIFGATNIPPPKPGGFTFGALNAKSPFEVTKDTAVKKDATPAKEQKDFSFVFKPKSPSSAKSPSKGGDGVEDVTDDENIEEENSTYFTPVIPLPDKIDVKTGEEDEEVLYSHRSKLFRFADGEWKERGLGDVKILRHKESQKLRVVMRREQILKICLNHVLNDEVEYKVKDDKSWHFIVNDFSEGEVELMQFCLRFKTPEIAQEFRQAVRDALNGNADTEAPNGIDEKISDEEESNILKLKLPSGFYSNKTECTGCRGCTVDDYVFPKYQNTDLDDENPLPLKQPIKQFSKSIPAKPTLSTFGQLSQKNIFAGTNNSVSDKGMFSQSSFTATPKGGPSIFGNNNSFSDASIFSQPIEEKKATTPADEVKKNFSFTGALKPSVFSQSIFGQSPASTMPSLTATFASSSVKPTEESSSENLFSFGKSSSTTTFSFAQPLNVDDSKITGVSTTNSTSSDQNIFTGTGKGTSLFGSSVNFPNNLSASSKFSFATASSTSNADTASLKDNGLSFAALAKSPESGSSASDNLFKVDSNLSFASLAAGQPSFVSSSPRDSSRGFYGLSNENAFSNFQKTANDSKKDDSNTDDATYDPHYDPIIPLPDEIVVRTGEEDEEKLFAERCKLYRYDATNKEWKERGVGEIKILHHPVNDTYRFLMRREQIFKCVLNHQISADLCVSPMKSSEKAFVWAAHNHGEECNGELEQLSVRFKNTEIAAKFINAVNSCISKLKAKSDGLEPEDD
ncbi:E3 SUMO-protein ligase RanBP2 [Pseudolycoriella hygida]|uniref:E3 SUMO-protein ligase RanBP2 n=1 Tax=Pseudolycoriella hygida TaxID=35572 RepID=A0A9Q0MNN0_9DIPT|nr:E3 SUMO-protein ligase RanBP2 [Pseudolycoriella hygida]